MPDDLDPDHVAVTRRQLHTLDCLPGAATTTRWSAAHNDRDEKKARKFLIGLRDASYTLTTIEEAR